MASETNPPHHLTWRRRSYQQDSYRSRSYTKRTRTMVVTLLLGLCLSPPCVCVVQSLSIESSSSSPSSRRDFLRWSRQAMGFLSVGAAVNATTTARSRSYAWALDTNNIQPKHPFVYSPEWTGTNLSLLSLEQSVQPEHLLQKRTADGDSDFSSSATTTSTTWQMGRWPDPILRRPASEVDPQWFGTPTLQYACQILQRTAQTEGAVGLAAQQCGVDARILYLEQPRPMVLVNPHIIRRSPETQGRVWEEYCLVLPPTFVATVVRDDWVDVQYHTGGGEVRQMRLKGEASRCVQHELDHDRGILVTDHVGLDELESDVMRTLERPGHDERMLLAYSRQVDSTGIGSNSLV